MLAKHTKLHLLWLMFLSFLACAQAKPPVVLDDELRRHLSDLQVVPSKSTESLSLSENVVVVTFFASWCPPCRSEFNTLNVIKRAFEGQPVEILAINAFEAFDDNDDVRMQAFLNDTQPEFLVVKGTDETLERFAGVNRIPTVFIFDRSGQTASLFIHKRGAKKMSMSEVEMRAAITAALNSSARARDP